VKLAGSLTADCLVFRTPLHCEVSQRLTQHTMFPRSLHLTCNYGKACSETPTLEQWHNAMNSSFDRGTRGLDCYGAAAGVEATC